MSASIAASQQGVFTLANCQGQCTAGFAGGAAGLGGVGGGGGGLGPGGHPVHITGVEVHSFEYIVGPPGLAGLSRPLTALLASFLIALALFIFLALLALLCCCPKKKKAIAAYKKKSVSTRDTDIDSLDSMGSDRLHEVDMKLPRAWLQTWRGVPDDQLDAKLQEAAALGWNGPEMDKFIDAYDSGGQQTANGRDGFESGYNTVQGYGNAVDVDRSTSIYANTQSYMVDAADGDRSVDDYATVHKHASEGLQMSNVDCNTLGGADKYGTNGIEMQEAMDGYASTQRLISEKKRVDKTVKSYTNEGADDVTYARVNKPSLTSDQGRMDQYTRVGDDQGYSRIERSSQNVDGGKVEKYYSAMEEKRINSDDLMGNPGDNQTTGWTKTEMHRRVTTYTTDAPMNEDDFMSRLRTVQDAGWQGEHMDSLARMTDMDAFELKRNIETMKKENFLKIYYAYRRYLEDSEGVTRA